MRDTVENKRRGRLRNRRGHKGHLTSLRSFRIMARIRTADARALL